jgi:hypothetical protein
VGQGTWLWDGASTALSTGTIGITTPHPLCWHLGVAAVLTTALLLVIYLKFWLVRKQPTDPTMDLCTGNSDDHPMDVDDNGSNEPMPFPQIVDGKIESCLLDM